MANTALNHFLHLFRCHLSIALALVRVFIYNGGDDEELASQGARAMNFDANMAVPVGVQVMENITWHNEMGGCQIPPLRRPLSGRGYTVSQCYEHARTIRMGGGIFLLLLPSRFS